MSKKTSIHKTLVVSVATIVVVPLILSFGYFLHDSYKAGIERARFSVQKDLDSEASQLKNRLFSLQYHIADSSKNKAIGEMAVNILLAQFAHKELQELVEDTSAIDSAFISDGSRFIIEGYPNRTYTIDTSAVAPIASHVMENASEFELPALLVLRESELYGRTPRENDTKLFFVMPLRKELVSLITPFKITSVLFVQLNSRELAPVLENKSSSIELRFGDKELFRVESTRPGEQIMATAEVLNPSLDMDKQSVLQLTIGMNEAEFLSRFWENLVVTLVVTLLTVALLLAMVFRLSQRLKEPLTQLTQTAKKFNRGNYQPNTQEQQYLEFDQTINAMNKMAKTISDQIENLEDAKATAEKSEQLKTQFLANMSHEIRTPMNGVIGLVDVLAGKVSADEHKTLIRKINDSAHTLLTIVNDILDLSKIEAGKMQIENINFNVKKILLSIAQTYSKAADLKGISIEVDSRNLTQDWWQGDPVRITQVLNNLVSNAVKFTEVGNVRVIVSDKVINDARYLEFSCIDTGVGLSEEQISRLFRKFEQADNTTTRRYGGTGLGLSICKSLVELMRGEVTVESVMGKGSEFRFTVAACFGEAESERNDGCNKPAPDLSNYKVLVAEDNLINQEILQYMLAETKIAANFVENGSQAVQAVANHAPDIILMDVQMPIMSGVDATLKIRQAGFKKPIVMQTANVMADEVATYKRVGADAHVGKPLDKQQLFKTLEYLLTQSQE